MKMLNDFILVEDIEKNENENSFTLKTNPKVIDVRVVATSQDDISVGDIVKVNVNAPKEAYLDSQKGLKYVRRFDIIMIL